MLCEEPPPLADPGIWITLEQGASDLLCWQPEVAPEIKIRFERWREIDERVAHPSVSQKMVGISRAWLACLRQIVEATSFTQEPVLLTGETGTGKELAANLIYSLDDRRRRYEFVVLDCTTIVPDLSGSELFGHERGAFTGAISARDGAFALADRGVLFLDEVGELPLNLQVQLLRALQERTYKRVGSNVWHNTDFRLVCATNRDLLAEVEGGSFRRDLYYRLASWKIHLPSLSERKEDILPLVHHYLNEGNSDRRKYFLDPPVEAYLLNWEYPGNVRDLKNLTLRLKARSAGRTRITLGDIPLEDRETGQLHPVSKALSGGAAPDGSAAAPVVEPAQPQSDSSPSGDTTIRQQFAASIHQAFEQGSDWDDIEKAFRAAATQAAEEITGRDMAAACKRLKMTRRTFREWANGSHRNGKNSVENGNGGASQKVSD